MQTELAKSCLIVFNSYRKLNLDLAENNFRKTFEEKFNQKIESHLINLIEPAGTKGNLPGYLTAYQKLKEEMPEEEINNFDVILFVHDAGLATRIFPLSYESGTPLKSTIRFPEGFAVETVFRCLAKSLPLLKGSVIILPIDQYFIYDEIDIEKTKQALSDFTVSMVVTPVTVERAVGSLGTVKLEDNNKIAAFYEKTNDEEIIPRYTKDNTLANTFQLMTTLENLSKLQSAVDLFSSKPENQSYVETLNKTEWGFNKLICESLSLQNEELSQIQLAMKKSLQETGVTLGGIIANGFWEDWSSSITVYVDLLRKLVRENYKSVGNNNFFIRSQKIIASGKLKNCIFIDCDAIDLFGDYEDCIFINCDWNRIIGNQKTTNSLFYSMKKSNFLRRDMSNYVIARFVSGRRHIEFECEIDVNFRDLYQTMRKVSDDWVKYHEVIEAQPDKSGEKALLQRPPRSTP